MHLICLLLDGVKPCVCQICGSCAGSMMDDAIQLENVAVAGVKLSFYSVTETELLVFQH